MRDSAKGGNDTLTGGNSSGSGEVENNLVGDAEQMLGTTKGGNDVLTAGTATTGGSVSNDMWGDAEDRLDAAKGGADTFVFKDDVANGARVGTDNHIFDFNQSEHDKIQFSGVAGVDGFEDLIIVFDPVSGDTTINAGSDAVTLVDFTGALTDRDFVFT
jgi:hypothetical protein